MRKFTIPVKDNLRIQSWLKSDAKELFSLVDTNREICTKLGIPCVVFGPVGGDLHQDTEWVSLDSIEISKNVIEKVIEEL